MILEQANLRAFDRPVPGVVDARGRLVVEVGAGAVKLEGGVRVRKQIEAIVESHIPVMGHVGLTPQSIRRFGRYRVQRDEEAILEDAIAVVEAGAFAIVLESVPAEIASKITSKLSIPTIGIGAGVGCDGQVLVWQDAMGLFTEFRPKFAKQFADMHTLMKEAVTRYAQEVRSREFPDPAHSYR